MKIYYALAQHIKHKEFWLPVVLFLNFNIYVYFYSMFVGKCFYFVVWFLFVNTRIAPTLNKVNKYLMEEVLSICI